ncbi:MAG: hypothetical protein KAI74_03890 [Kiritimatiellae bacterium]|nr:hypothetical protein [Kiritimatiellia bacterium]
MKRKTFIILLFLVAVVAEAQWKTQAVLLEPGWNAVYIITQPVPASCDHVFNGVPVESVAWWSRIDGGAEYSEDPNDPFPQSAHWFKWVPGQLEASTFGSLLAGQTYLVNLETNVSVLVEIKGRAEVLNMDWLRDKYNLVGFPIISSEDVTFGDYFGFTDEVSISTTEGGDVQQVNSDGSVSQVYRPQMENIGAGKAYWVKSGERVSSYIGPVKVKIGNGDKWLDYDLSQRPQTLKITNETDTNRLITIRHIASEEPAEGIDATPLAGKVPLLLGRMITTNGTVREEFEMLPDLLVTNIATGTMLELHLMPDVSALTNGAEGEAFQSILKITDESSSVPVIEQNIGVVCRVPPADFYDTTGLWVGEVVVDKVSRAPTRPGGSNTWDTVTPVPVSRSYNFRVLLHSRSNGTCRILQQIYPSMLTKDDGDIELKLFTKAEYAKQYRNDNPKALITRISSANFAPTPPIECSGDFGNGTVMGVVDVAFNDPVNPFVHSYHPQHDNREINNGIETVLGAGIESFDISRELQFVFDEIDPMGGGNPSWNITECGGVFKERVVGLNKTIYVSGLFRLVKLSECGVLSY